MWGGGECLALLSQNFATNVEGLVSNGKGDGSEKESQVWHLGTEFTSWLGDRFFLLDEYFRADTLAGSTRVRAINAWFIRNETR